MPGTRRCLFLQSELDRRRSLGATLDARALVAAAAWSRQTNPLQLTALMRSEALGAEKLSWFRSSELLGELSVS